MLLMCKSLSVRCTYIYSKAYVRSQAPLGGERPGRPVASALGPAGGANGFASALSRRSMAVYSIPGVVFCAKIVICPKA